MLSRIFKQITLCVFVMGFVKGYTQNNLSGVVVDSLTRAPVPFANIFFANTLIGTATDLNGNFHLKKIPDGKYDFTISCIGYKTFQQSIELTNTHLQDQRILLSQNPIKLSEVKVLADTTGWYQNFKTFKKSFIGEFRSARESVIKKPRDIYLYFDPRDRVLVAHASHEIMIENHGLGYTIFYSLNKFELNYKEGRMEYYGVPRFTAMVPKKPAEEKKWAKQRERVFRGSLSHLWLAMLNNNLEREEFQVNELYRVKNPERPSEKFLNAKIAYWREQRRRDQNSETEIRRMDDSLRHYYELRSKPVLVDSIGKQIMDTHDIMEGNVIHYKGLLRIIYKGEREEVEYAHAQERAPLRYQYSTLHLLGESLKIYDNGYFENVNEVFLEGYLGWYEKIGNLLPLEYSLPDN